MSFELPNGNSIMILLLYVNIPVLIVLEILVHIIQDSQAIQIVQKNPV